MIFALFVLADGEGASPPRLRRVPRDIERPKEACRCGHLPALRLDEPQEARHG